LYNHIYRWCWNLDTTSDYTVKSVCITIDKIIFPDMFMVASLLWKGLIPPKIEVFLWKLMHDNLCIREFLADRHIISNQQSTCPFCDYETKSSSHLFLHFLEPWKIWSGVYKPGPRIESRVLPGSPGFDLVTRVNPNFFNKSKRHRFD